MAQRAKFWSVFIVLALLAVTALADAPQLAETTKISTLRWKKIVIPIAFSNSLLRPNPAIRPDSDIQGAIRNSLDTWEAAANIEFQVSWTEKSAISPAGNAGDGTSLVTVAQTPENLLVFGGEASDIAARTRVFFNRKNEISEADIVLNPYQQFSTDGAIGTFDFESTLKHEIGHLLGLEHSTVVGATMNELQGKNGVFNLPGYFSPRTLSEDDVTQIRALYGARDDDECCGALDGKLSLANGRAAKSFNVWLEEPETGRVIVGSRVNADGSFLLKGLNPSKYQIYAQDPVNNFGGQSLGEVEIAKNKTTSFVRKITPQANDFDVQLTGFMGQLSRLAIPINGGKSYTIYVGGKNLNPEDFKIGTTSPFLTVAGGNFTKYDYGKDISVFSFEIKAMPETPVGDYTIYLQKNDGKIQFLTGNLSVEKFSNSGGNLASE